jgi:hypothetical protein
MSPTPTCWTTARIWETAQAISPDGRYIVGTGYNAATERREAYLLDTRPSRRDGDVNGDGCVDDSDLLRVLFAFGATGNNLPEDLTRDGISRRRRPAAGAVQLRQWVLNLLALTLSSQRRGRGESVRSASLNRDSTAMNSDSTPANRDSTTTNPDSTPANRDSTAMNPDSTPVNRDSTTMDRMCGRIGARRGRAKSRRDHAHRRVRLSLPDTPAQAGYNSRPTPCIEEATDGDHLLNQG